MDKVKTTVQDVGVQVSDVDEPVTPNVSRKRRQANDHQGNTKRRRQNLNVEIVNEEEDSEPKPETSWSYFDCPICRGPLERSNMTATKCGHVFCSNCIKKALLTSKTCPSCRKKITLKTIFPLYL